MFCSANQRMKEINEMFPDYHDEDFLAPKSGAKLASLFDLDRAESQGNDSFQFIAPRQPKRLATTLGPPPQKQAPPPEAQAVLLATAVHAFRFVKGQYIKQGKLGMAILGNHVAKQYKVLLYDSKQKQITTARIHHGFVLTVQPGNYMSFYDDQHQNWSLKFDSEKAGIDFCKEVCVARWNSQTGLETPVTQDLLLGEGQAVDMGDAVKFSFSGWLLQNYAIGQMFESSMDREKLQRVKLGSGKALRGLEQGMLGMQKGGRRLLILSASVAYGSQGVPNGVPSTSTVAFDVELCWVKLSKGGEYRGVGSAGSASVSRIPGLDGLRVEEAERLVLCISPEQGCQAAQVKSGPVNALPVHRDPDKAMLISRMARVGQPMLPCLIGATLPQLDPSNLETKAVGESGLGCDPPSLPASPQLTQTASSPPPSAAPVPLLHPGIPAALTQSYPVAQRQAFPSVCPPQHMSYCTDVSSFLLTEARQQNTELQLSVARVTDKVDQMVTKVEELQKQGVCPFGLSSVSLETAIILHNIERIIQENVSLKKEVLEKASKVEEQNRKIEELTEQKQRYMEQSNRLLEQKNDILQNSSRRSHDRLLRAEEEKVCLAEELATSSSRVCKLQQDVGCLQQRATELQAKLGTALQDSQSRCALIRSLEDQVEELKNEAEQSRQQWRAEKQKCRKMEMTVKTKEEEIQDLRAEKERLDQILSDRKRKWQLERERLLMEQEEWKGARPCTETLPTQQLAQEWRRRHGAAQGVIADLREQRVPLWKEVLSESHMVVQVKRVMNTLFHSLRVEFDLQESYTGASVLSTLLYMIKHVTIQFLKEESVSETDDDEEEEEYLSAEETQSEGKEEKKEENGTEKENHIPARLDFYMTKPSA